MPIDQRLQQRHHIGLAHPGRSLHHHGLVELIDRTLHALQPTHDRGGHHRPEALIDYVGRSVGYPGHPRQPGHGLLSENITRPTQQTRRPGAGHHLHRQNAVAAQLEERVVDPDPLQPQHLGVDAGQNLLDRTGRGAIPINVGVFGCRQGAGVEFSVDRQRQRVEHHHRDRHHITRQPLTQRSADPVRIRRLSCRLGHITHQTLIAGAVLAGDHHRLINPIAARPTPPGLHPARCDTRGS